MVNSGDQANFIACAVFVELIPVVSPCQQFKLDE